MLVASSLVLLAGSSHWRSNTPGTRFVSLRAMPRSSARARNAVLHDGDTLADEAAIVSRDPYEILGVARDASRAELQRAYRLKARKLHPDVSADPSSVEHFRELVNALAILSNRPPGSRETHPLWPYLDSIDQYWSREQGHDTADELEQYLKDLGKYDGYLCEMRLDMEALAAAPAKSVPAEGVPGEEAADDAVADETASGGSDLPNETVAQATVLDIDCCPELSRITELLSYRLHLGNHQWQVRWTDGSMSWERFGVLDSELLRQEAEQLRTTARRRVGVSSS